MQKKNNFYLILIILGSFLFGFSLVVLPAPTLAVTDTSSSASSTPVLTRQQMITEIERLIKEITKEIERISAEQKAKTTTQTTKTTESSGGASQSDGSSQSNSGSSGSESSAGGAGAMKPFGGLSTSVVTCTCRWDTPKSWISLIPAKNDLPRDVIYEKASSILYEYKMVETPNQQLLGTVSENTSCRMQVYAYCVTVKTAPKIYMVGTSGGSGGGNPPPSGGQEDPPPPQASSTPPTTPPDQCKRMGEKAYTYNSKGTGYYPDSSAMEGGFNDRLGKPLRTLQAFLSGNADYVSVAMDNKAFPYGTELCIPELEQKYGKQIIFRVVDTGSAFNGSDPARWGPAKGTTRIDICTANESASNDPTVNGALTLVSSVSSSR